MQQSQLYQRIVSLYEQPAWSPLKGDSEHTYVYDMLVYMLESDGIVDCPPQVWTFLREYLGTLAIGCRYDPQEASMLLIKLLGYEDQIVQIQEKNEEYFLQSTPRCEGELRVRIRVPLRRVPSTGHPPTFYAEFWWESEETPEWFPSDTP